MVGFEKEPGGVIFLLGAGASKEAGMPLVSDLSKEVRKLLPTLSDMNGRPCPEFGQVFDFIAAYDPTVLQNYERFFEWIYLLLNVQKEPFGKVVKVAIEPYLNTAMAHLPFVLGQAVSTLLASRKTDPGYMARITDAFPPKGRLKVFSLNYDCCLEDACVAAGIDVTTGFDPTTKRWTPSLFSKETRGINLYKLHGSLRWFLMDEEKAQGSDSRLFQYTVELQPGDRQKLAAHCSAAEKPDLVLGPGSKLQPDEPFLTLFYEFSRAARSSAEVCVVIGYGHRDDHIDGILCDTLDAGTWILDVNLDGPCGKYLAENRYRHLRSSAKGALLDGSIMREVAKLG